MESDEATESTERGAWQEDADMSTRASSGATEGCNWAPEGPGHAGAAPTEGNALTGADESLPWRKEKAQRNPADQDIEARPKQLQGREIANSLGAVGRAGTT